MSTGDWTRESGGERGDSGRSSRKMDCVRRGAPALRNEVALDGCETRCGGRLRDISSREVLEKELSDMGTVRGGPLMDLRELLKMEEKNPLFFLEGESADSASFLTTVSCREGMAMPSFGGAPSGFAASSIRASVCAESFSSVAEEILPKETKKDPVLAFHRFF